MAQNLHGMPIPELDEKTDSYRNFRKEVLLWESATNLEAEKRAVAILLKLPAKAKSVALDISRDELTKGKTYGEGETARKITGVERLLEVLDTVFLEDMNKEKFKAYRDIRNYKRQKSQPIQDFLLEYDKRIRRLGEFGIDLPQEVLAFEILDSSNLTTEQESMANATVKELTYNEMKDQIRKIAISVVPQEDVKPIVVQEETYFNHEDDETDVDQEEVAYYSNYRSRGRSRRGRSFNNYQQRRPHYQNRGFGGKTRKSGNPKDQYGNPFRCHNCNSTQHFVRECPDYNSSYYSKDKQQETTENVALFQHSQEDKTCSTDTMKKFTGENLGLAVLDTGCNTTVCGREWLDSYLESLNEKDRNKVLKERCAVSFRFGDNKPTESSEKITFPAVVCNKDVNIVAQVVDANIPLLISKQTMANAKMVMDFSDYTITAFGHTQKMLKTASGHCSIPLSKKNVYDEVCLCSNSNIVLHTEEDKKDQNQIAQKLHKQFAHPTPERLKSLITTAGKKDKELFKQIDIVSKNCETCARYKRPEPHPVVCMPTSTEFNDTVAMDLKTFDAAKGIYFQHMIDHRTRFSTAKVIYSKGKEELIESVFTHWIAIFGRPRRFLSDNGGEYNNAHFLDMCDKLGVHVVTTGAESPWSNGLVERHHALISRNVSKIMEETDCSVSTALAWAVNAKNSLSNINGYSPYQLLLGVNPSIPSLDNPYESPTCLEQETPSQRVAKHLQAMYNARKQQMAAEADERIRRALRSKSRDVYAKSVSQGDKVFYKREDCSRWRGPATVIGRDGKVVFLRHGGFQIKCHLCRVVNVNEIYKDDSRSDTPGVFEPPDPPNDLNTQEDFAAIQEMITNDVTLQQMEQPVIERNEEQIQPVTCRDQDNSHNKENATEEDSVGDSGEATKIQKLCDTKSVIEKKRISICVKDKDPFAKEKKSEIEKWIENNVFEVVAACDIPEEVEPISVSWVLTDNGEKRKARLVARGFEEEPLRSESTHSPTGRKESLRLLFSIVASMNWTIKTIDITSAFLQGQQIDRLVYLVPPKEAGGKNVLWKLNKCVYGLSDAARMFYETVKQSVEDAGIVKSPIDNGLFHWKRNKEIEGVLSIHVDDFVYGGTDNFQNLLNNSIFTDFCVGQQSCSLFKYLGLEVVQDKQNEIITVSQKEFVQKIAGIQISEKRKRQKTHALAPDEYTKFRSLCGKLLWLSLQSRPDISFEVCQLSNHLANPNVEDILRINKLVKKLQHEDCIALQFKKIQLEEGRLRVYADAAYANLPNHGSQCGYIVFLTDSRGQVENPIVWKSIKLERICQSALGAEALSLLKAVDHAFLIQQTFENITGRTLPMDCFTDSKSLYEILLNTKDPEEKKLIGKIAPLRQSIEKGEITIQRISSKMMPADILTKRGVNSMTLRDYLS